MEVKFSSSRALAIWAMACVSFALGALSALSARGEEPLSRIYFGSCARQDKPQPIWEAIVAQKPQLFLMIGDNIYGDSQEMEVLRAKYAMLGAQPGFKKLRATCPLLATWDDHDYGVNDGGKEYPKRAESQQVFNDFFEVPLDSPRRKRPGVYEAFMFGPEEQRVQVILLDTRYFRDALRRWPAAERPKGRGPYRPHELDSGATMLGEAQWKWLAEELKKPADVRIIASSIQIVPTENCWEIWNNFPAERQRLFDLIAETKATGVVLLSGDRHTAEISCLPAKESPTKYPLYDVTSSSLNAPGGASNAEEPNRYRVAGKNYGGINFGSVVIDWSLPDPSLVLAIHDGEGKSVREVKLKLSELK